MIDIELEELTPEEVIELFEQKLKGGSCRSYSNPEQCRNNKACTYCRQKLKDYIT
jgi:hypothetical protein